MGEGSITAVDRLSRLLPPGGSILELGCGAGNHSAEMLASGFQCRVRPTVRRKWPRSLRAVSAIRSRRCCSMTSTSDEAYDGVWASACLLHVPRDELARILR